MVHGSQKANLLPESKDAGANRNPVGAILAERNKTHGDFGANARISQAIKEKMKATPHWAALNNEMKETLEMIALKISRILSGDPWTKDHWDDIAGYASLASKSCDRD